MINLPFRIISQKGFQKLLVQNQELNSEVVRAGEFIDQMRKGDLNLAGNQEEEDTSNLVRALIGMQDELRELAREEKKRVWISEGLALFSGLLKDNQDLKQLGDRILSDLVKYLGAVQGGIFILSEGEKSHYLELISSYAYNREKIAARKVLPGEGLLGQAFVEGKKIKVDDLPDSYLKLTTGLGETPPAYLHIIPLKINDEVFGLIELAFLKKLEEHEENFLDILSDNIAAVLANVRIQERTQSLLLQYESQRAELVWNNKRLYESDLTLQTIIDCLPIAVFWKDKDGVYQGCNQIFAQVAGLENSKDIMGKDDFALPWTKEEAEAYRADDQEVMRSNQSKLNIIEKQHNHKGELTWLSTSKVPLISPEGGVSGIVGMFEDITKKKRQEEELVQKIEKIQEIEASLRIAEQKIKALEKENEALKKEVKPSGAKDN